MLCFAVTAASVAQTTSEPSATTKPATTQPGDTTLRVHTVRINRQSPEIQKQFRGRQYNDGNAGVQMQLILTTPDEMLQPTQDAVTIETFVDDTYQSLLATNRQNNFSGPFMNPAVSEDGRSLLFGVQAPRAPADEADRVFVRGTVQTRIARGKARVETGRLKLAINEQAQIGPFRTVIRSISDNGRTTNNLNLAVEGDVSLVRKIRALGPNEKALHEPIDLGQIQQQQQQGMPASTNINLTLPAGHEEVTLEFTVAERIESVRIPFEAQIDCGAVKAGPIEVIDPKPAAGRRPMGDRAWPPPPASRVELPPSRPAMTMASPASPASTQPRELKAGVDIFSLMVSKPAPEQSKAVKWTNPPERYFRAAGYTAMRLMITTPEKGILSVPYDGLNITKFEDDTGAKLDTTVFRGSDDSLYFGVIPLVHSIDGQQMLMTLFLASPPTPGATRFTLGGTFKANVGRNPQAVTSEPLKMQTGEKTTIGPFTFTVQHISRSMPSDPQFLAMSAMTKQTNRVVLQVEGPLSMLRDVQPIDPDPSNSGRRITLPAGVEKQTQTNLSFTLSESFGDSIRFNVRYNEGTEMVTVPFEVTTPLGL
ncbi:MAG TPA: hypothetical protein VGB55_02160 [Tepidisphaeraceae bacterium]